MAESVGTVSRASGSPASGSVRALGKRARRRQELEAKILLVARQHLATDGPAGLSLRAIARDLGMVSSGIYRYVDSRDELLTRLIVDSYSSLAAAVSEALTGVADHDLPRRWDALGFAVRAWALEHTHDYGLIYGTPVPGYQAPPERTTGPGTAVLGLMTELLRDAKAAGRLRVDLRDERSGQVARRAMAAVGPFLNDALVAGSDLSATDLSRGIAAWTLILGAVSSEVFGQLGELPDPEALFGCLLDASRDLIFR